MSRENPISEDAPIFASTAKRRQFGYDAKRPNEPWNQAYKYLESRVGDRWNDVWADICMTTDSSWNVDRDKEKVFNLIREQVNRGNMVYLDCFERDGAVYHCRYGEECRVDKEKVYARYKRAQLYVHNGVLRSTEWEKVERPKEQKVVQFNGQEFAQKDGVWYRVVLKPISHYDIRMYISSYDTLRKRSLSCGDGYRFYGRSAYCSAHYPLKNKELKALKDHINGKVQ
jgi:hypothetical protein